MVLHLTMIIIHHFTMCIVHWVILAMSVVHMVMMHVSGDISHPLNLVVDVFVCCKCMRIICRFTEAVIWNTVSLDSDVNITIMLSTGHTKSSLVFALSNALSGRP
jgi:hypothetical protein